MPTWSSWSATCRPAGRLPDGLAHIVHLTDRPQTASLSDALVHSVCGAVPEALQVAALARRWAAPVVATMRGGPQVDTIPHFRGYVGSSGHVAANKLLRDADAVLVLGVSSRGAAFELLPPRASIVDVNTDPEPLHARGGDICLRADVATLVRQILDAPSSAPRDGRSAAAPDPREHDLLAAESTPTLRGELRPSFVIRVLDRCAEAHPGKVGWTADVGLNTLWLYRFRRSHRTTMWTGNFATMGFAVPAAVANSAHWGCPTIAVTGDGGAAMMLPALGKLRGGEPPVLVVVLNNSGLGAIRYEQEIMGWPEYNSAFCDSDFAQYAVASGWAGRRVTTAAELNAAVAEFFREPRPMLIDAVCSADEAPVPALLPSAPRVASMAFALRDGARPPPHSVVCGAAGTPRHPRTRTGAPNKHDRLVR
jgi:thiamine pyrophosphate-dependent acetolactate synthase large subunit-like protein